MGASELPGFVGTRRPGRTRSRTEIFGLIDASIAPGAAEGWLRIDVEFKLTWIGRMN